ncbi:MAG: histidine phosphatase family protein [Rubrobacteraceae bacterium]|jgi:2,3-bisphosphoglycerate-dependent phosphoglycerate mutase
MAPRLAGNTAAANNVGELHLVRHCEAMGQSPDAALTEEGVRQSERLADFLSDKGISRIISSPFLRARRSALPLSERLGVEIEDDDRLAERILCASPMSDWKEKLRDAFSDPDLRASRATVRAARQRNEESR